MNGGEMIATVLQNHGVPAIYTLCGGHISPILVAAKQKGIRIIDVRDEASEPDLARSMPFESIWEVRVGARNSVLMRGHADLESKEELCFSVVTAERSLELEAEDKQVRDQWVHALSSIIYYMGLMRKREAARAGGARATKRNSLTRAIAKGNSMREEKR